MINAIIDDQSIREFYSGNLNQIDSDGMSVNSLEECDKLLTKLGYK